MEYQRRQERRDEIAAKVALLKQLPRAPQLLRGGDSIFLSTASAYPAFVRQQRVARQEQDIAQRTNRFLTKQMTSSSATAAGDSSLSSPLHGASSEHITPSTSRPASVRASRRTSAEQPTTRQSPSASAAASMNSTNSGSNSMSGALRHVNRERARQWLVMIAVARFLAIPLEAAQLIAILKLRKLFAPVVARVRHRIKKKRRMAWLLIANHAKMHRPTVQSLKIGRASAFFASWPDDVLHRLLSRHMVPASEPCNTVLVTSGVTVADVIISDLGELGVFSARQPHAWAAVETSLTRRVTEPGCVLMGDLSIAAHFDCERERLIVEEREARRARNRQLGIFNDEEDDAEDNDDETDSDLESLQGGGDDDDDRGKGSHINSANDPEAELRRQERSEQRRRKKQHLRQMQQKRYGGGGGRTSPTTPAAGAPRRHTATAVVFKFELELRALGLGNTTMFWRIPHRAVMRAFRRRLSPAQQLAACSAARVAYLDVTAPLDPSRVQAALSRYNCSFPIEFVRALGSGEANPTTAVSVAAPAAAAAAAAAAASRGSAFGPTAAAVTASVAPAAPAASPSLPTALRPCFFTKGTQLFGAGERPSRFFIVVSGCVLLSRSFQRRVVAAAPSSSMAAGVEPPPPRRHRNDGGGAGSVGLTAAVSFPGFSPAPPQQTQQQQVLPVSTRGVDAERAGPWSCLELEESLICAIPVRSRGAVCETDVEAWVGDLDAIRKLFQFHFPTFCLAVRGALMRAESAALQRDTYAQHQARLRHLQLAAAAASKSLNGNGGGMAESGMLVGGSASTNINSGGGGTSVSAQLLRKQQQTELQNRLKKSAAVFGVEDLSGLHHVRRPPSAAAAAAAAARPRPPSSKPQSPRQATQQQPKQQQHQQQHTPTVRRVSISGMQPSGGGMVAPPPSDLVKALAHSPLFCKLPEDVLMAVCVDASPYITLPGDPLLASMKFGPHGDAASLAQAASTLEDGGGGGGVTAAAHSHASAAVPGFGVLVRGTAVIRLMQESERLLSIAAAPASASATASGGNSKAQQQQQRGAEASDDVAAEGGGGGRGASSDNKLAIANAAKDEVAAEQNPTLFLPHTIAAPALLGAHGALCSNKTSLAATISGGNKIALTADDNGSSTNSCLVWWEIRLSSLRNAVSREDFAQIVALCRQRTAVTDKCYANLVV